jgi:rieske iron-sulfur protein
LSPPVTADAARVAIRSPVMADPRPLAPNRSLGCPQRRTLLRGAAGLVLAWMTPIRASAQDVPPPAVGDLFVRVDDPSFIPLTPDDLPFDGRGVMVWPIGPTASEPKSGTPLNKILLSRVNPANLTDATRAGVADGILAFSAICTHSGCEVDESLGGNETLYCSCHGSTFDARSGGTVISGPAPRRLPQLPLKIDTGRLAVAGPFTTAPGYGPI